MLTDDDLNERLSKHKVKVRTTPLLGRTVHTTKPFKRGSIVLTDTVYTHCLHPRYTDTRCDYCYRGVNDVDANHPDNIATKIQLTRCSQCKAIYYCSKQCQLAAWKQWHKTECKVIAKNVNGLMDVPHDSLCDLVLCCRILRQMHSHPTDLTPLTTQQSHYQYVCDVFDAVANHVDPTTLPQYSGAESQYALITKVVDYKQMSYQLQGNREIARLALSTPALLPPNTTREQIENVLCLMQCNNFGIADDLLIERGSGVYVLGSLLNSSCDPSTTISYETMTIDGVEQHHVQVFRALCDIEAGAEITHTYTDIAKVTADRRRELAQKYYYYCKCQRCILPAERSLDRYLQGNADGTRNTPCSAHEPHKHNSKDTINTELQKADELQLQAEQSASTDSSIGAQQRELNWMIQCAAIRNKQLHTLHTRNIQTAGLLMNAALLVQNYTLAASVCAQLCDKYRAVYKPLTDGDTYHPLLGLQLYTLGSLYEQLNKFQQAHNTLTESMNILKVTHGSESRLVQQLQEHTHKLVKQLEL